MTRFPIRDLYEVWSRGRTHRGAADFLLDSHLTQRRLDGSLDFFEADEAAGAIGFRADDVWPEWALIVPPSDPAPFIVGITPGIRWTGVAYQTGDRIVSRTIQANGPTSKRGLPDAGAYLVAVTSRISVEVKQAAASVRSDEVLVAIEVDSSDGEQNQLVGAIMATCHLAGWSSISLDIADAGRAVSAPSRNARSRRAYVAEVMGVSTEEWNSTGLDAALVMFAGRYLTSQEQPFRQIDPGRLSAVKTPNRWQHLRPPERKQQCRPKQG